MNLKKQKLVINVTGGSILEEFRYEKRVASFDYMFFVSFFTFVLIFIFSWGHLTS